MEFYQQVRGVGLAFDRYWRQRLHERRAGMAKVAFRASISGEGADARARYFVDGAECDLDSYVAKHVKANGAVPEIPIGVGGRAARADEQARIDADPAVAAFVAKYGVLPEVGPETAAVDNAAEAKQVEVAVDGVAVAVPGEASGEGAAVDETHVVGNADAQS